MKRECIDENDTATETPNKKIKTVTANQNDGLPRSIIFEHEPLFNSSDITSSYPLTKAAFPPIKVSYLFNEALPLQFYNDYQYISPIGQGKFGAVIKAHYTKTGETRAIKKVVITAENQLEEIEILKKLSHPNIVSPIEYCRDSDDLFIVTEYCEGGTLYDRIAQEGRLNEDICKNYAKQILSGLAYCHHNGIVHRDIKPENLLFDTTTSNARIKIIDFGISTKFSKNYFLDKKCGTCYYIAPEIIKGRYNEKVDIWSLGVVLYVMFTGRPPVDGDNQINILMKIMNLKQIDFSSVEKFVSPAGVSFLKQMLEISIDNRASANMLLQHEWLQTGSSSISPIAFNKALKGLRNFTSYTYIQNIIYFYSTSLILRREEKQKLSMLFSELDKDNDGKLSKQELIQAFQHSGRSLDRSTALVDKILKELNMEDNGGIEYTHFLVTCCKKQDNFDENLLQKAFEIWDADKKGFIDMNDIKSIVIKGFGDEDNGIASFKDNLIEELELEGINRIDFEGFLEIMHRFVEDEKISQSLTYN